MIYKECGPNQRKMIVKWLKKNELIHQGNVNNQTLKNIVKYLTGHVVSPSRAKYYLWDYINTNSSFIGCEVFAKTEVQNKPQKKKNKVDFYKTKEWRELRVKALISYGRKCCLCGRGVKNGVVLHVDHIKPISKRPDLMLTLSNLQILCEDCNIGKSNKYSEKWR